MPDFDTRELGSLAQDFTAAGTKVIPALVPVASKAGVNIKRTMKSDASGHDHLPGLASKVNYEVSVHPLSVEVEVGFVDEGQGELANIAAYGSVNNAPVMDITRGLNEEVPRFMKAAAMAAAKALD